MPLWTYQGVSATANLLNVNTFADLPAAADSAGMEYVVLTATGVWPVNRKSAGVYYSDGSNWTFKGAAPNDVGLPTGGTTGQALTKVDSTDFNLQWATISGGGGSSVSPFWSLTHSPTGGNSFRENGNGATPANSGTFTAADANLLSAFGNHIQAATPATLNNNAGIRHGARLFLANSPNYNTTGSFVSYFGTPTSIGAGATGGRMAVGLLTSNALDDMLVNDILQYAGLAFTYSTNLGQTVWHYQNKGSNTPTPIATSLTYGANKLMKVTITLTADPTVHIMRLDNLTDNTSTGDISVTRTITGASSGLYAHCGIRTLSATSLKMYICDQTVSSLGVRNA